MAYLAKLSTAITVPFGPILDSTGAEYTGAAVGDLKISKNNGTPAALNGSATLTHKEVGIYELVLTTSDISAVGNLVITLSKTTYVAAPVVINVLPAVVYDATVAGTDNLDVNVVQVLGSATAATLDSLSSQINGIGSSSGASLNFAVSDDNVDGAIPSTPFDNATVSFTGTVDAGTYADTTAAGGTAHTISDSGNVIRIVEKFAIGAGRNAAAVTMYGRITVGDSVTVKAWNGTTDTWDLRKTITGASAYAVHDIKLLAAHTETGSYAGQVYLLFECATDSTLYIDELLCSGVSVASTTGYSDGAVWVKATGNSGTTVDVNGTADNPCPWADALVIATAKGLSRFRILNGETVTLTGACESKSLIGRNWTLALGGQSISGSYIEGAVVTGSGTGASQPKLVDCFIGSGTGAVSMPPSNMLRCGFNVPSGNAFSAASAGNWTLADCYSQVAGSATPVFTFSGANYINMRRWSGGTNITLDNTLSQLSIEVVTGGGQTVAVGGADVEIRGICRSVTLTGVTTDSTIQIDAVTGPISIAGADGTVNIYGVAGAVTDNRTGTPTLLNHASINSDTDAILEDTGTTLPATLTTISGYVDCLPTTLNNLSSGDVQTAAAAALTAYDPPTNAEMEARTLVAANYATSANQTSILGYVDCLPAIWVTVPTTAEIKTAIEAAGSHLALILEDTGTTLPATLTTINGYVDCLPASWVVPLDAAGTRTAVGLAAANLDTQLGNIPTVTEFEARTLVAASYATSTSLATAMTYIDTEVAAILLVAQKLDTLLEADGAVYRLTLNALELAPTGSGSGLDAAGVRAAIGMAAADLDTQLEEILAAASPSGGAYTQTITVTDADDLAIPNARVRIYSGTVLVDDKTTNSSGIASPTCDLGSFTLKVTCNGYSSSVTTLAVTGNASTTVELTAISITASDPGFVTGYLYCYDSDGNIETGVTITLEMVEVPAGSGSAFDNTVRVDVSNGVGLVEFTGLVLGATYKVRRANGASVETTVPLTATDPYALPSVLGQEP